MSFDFWSLFSRLTMLRRLGRARAFDVAAGPIGDWSGGHGGRRQLLGSAWPSFICDEADDASGASLARWLSTQFGSRYSSPLARARCGPKNIRAPQSTSIEQSRGVSGWKKLSPARERLRSYVASDAMLVGSYIA